MLLDEIQIFILKYLYLFYLTRLKDSNLPTNRVSYHKKISMKSVITKLRVESELPQLHR